MIISKRGNNYTTRAQYRRRVLKRRRSRQQAQRHEAAVILFICVFVLITILSALRLVTTYAQPTFEAVAEIEPLEKEPRLYLTKRSRRRQRHKPRV